MIQNNYQSPDIEIVDIQVEQGFMASPGSTLEGFQDGGTW